MTHIHPLGQEEKNLCKHISEDLGSTKHKEFQMAWPCSTKFIYEKLKKLWLRRPEMCIYIHEHPRYTGIVLKCCSAAKN